MSVYKRGGKIYWYKFMWRGKCVRESTRQTSAMVARNMEAAHRARLANGEAGIRERKRIPTLAEFLKDAFLPFVKSHFGDKKPKTRDYYCYGAELLLAAGLGKFKLDELTSQHAVAFQAKRSHLAASTMNCGLRTLRRSLKLAGEWGTLERVPKITLAIGERERDRVVGPEELNVYLDVCKQPWRDVAIILYGTAMRPGEAYRLRWEHLSLHDNGGVIHITEGKTKAARRILPMLPIVHGMLRHRWERAGKPTNGWIFPANTKSGHVEEGSTKNQHIAALRILERATATYKEAKHELDWPSKVSEATRLDVGLVRRNASAIMSGVMPFPPYCLRHTALTRLAESGCDAFTLKKIAGHNSITITQKYCHPQAEAVERAFKQLATGHNSRHSAGMPLLVSASRSALSASSDGR